jgi:putative ABC transport system permease protein
MARLIRPLVVEGAENLVADWRRHALTVAGIVWGAAAVVFLVALGAGFYAFLDSGFKKTGDLHSVIAGQYTTSESGGARPGRRIVLERADVERVTGGVPSAAVVAAEAIRATVSVRSPARTRSTVVSAATAELRLIQQLRVARGRFFDASDDRALRPVAVIGASLAAIFFPHEDPLGRRLDVAGRAFEVIGVLQRKGPQLMVNWALHDDMIFLPLGAGLRLFGSRAEVDLIHAKPARLEDVPALHREVRAALAPWHHVEAGDAEAIRVDSVTEFTEPFRNIAAGLVLLLGLVGTVALSMAAVGVANLMLAIVNDRRMELAVRRACGARRSDLILQLLVETLAVVLAGGLIGVGVGVALAQGVALLPLPEELPAPQLSWSTVLTTAAVLGGVGLGAGVAPARLASQVDPAAAMRVT